MEFFHSAESGLWKKRRSENICRWPAIQSNVFISTAFIWQYLCYKHQRYYTACDGNIYLTVHHSRDGNILIVDDRWFKTTHPCLSVNQMKKRKKNNFFVRIRQMVKMVWYKLHSCIMPLFPIFSTSFMKIRERIYRIRLAAANERVHFCNRKSLQVILHDKWYTCVFGRAIKWWHGNCNQIG